MFKVHYVTETNTSVLLDAVFTDKNAALDRANEINRGAPKHKPAVGSSYYAWVE